MKKILLPFIIIACIGAAYYYYTNTSSAEEVVELSTKVYKGKFVVNVTATGELKAKRSEKVRGPQGMRSVGVYQTTIQDIVAEGTIVAEGDYVAKLDPTEIANKLKDISAEIEKVDQQLIQAKLDTAIDMRGLRDQIINLNFNIKEKRLEVEQSKYEPPMVIRQAQLELERIQRDLTQKKENLHLKQEQAEARINEIQASLDQNQNKKDNLSEIGKQFVIKAPKAGMLIYARSWRGKKGPGSQISAWDPVVAELPDLTDMISKTYVNEVDISKVHKGQKVQIKVDAFPDKEYEGTVFKVANIGEELPNFDAKVFEVEVQVEDQDSILRPSMTTSNEILTEEYSQKLFISLEALFRDSLTYVLQKKGDIIKKQEVITGISNDENIVVELGLQENDEILLSIPEDISDIPLILLDATVKQEYDNKRKEKIAKKKQKAIEDKKIRNEKKEIKGKVKGKGGKKRKKQD